MGKTNFPHIPFTAPMASIPRPYFSMELMSSVTLFVTSILLQVFALDGYTTRKFQIVLYTWVSHSSSLERYELMVQGHHSTGTGDFGIKPNRHCYTQRIKYRIPEDR